MASNNFDGAVIIDNGVGTPASPGGYYGFGRAPLASSSNGPRIYAGTGNPNGVLVAPMSSLYLQTNGVTGTMYIATDSIGGWTGFATNIDVAVLQAEIAVIQGQIVVITAQIASILAAVATNTAAIAAANANLLSFIDVLASASGAAHIGVAIGGTLQTQLDYIMSQLSSSTSVVRDWFPLIPQSPLNPLSDYFSAGVIPGKWTQLNPGANTTFTCPTSTRLTMVQTTHAGAAWAGLCQPAPVATRYAVTVLMSIAGNPEGFISGGGAMIGGDLIGHPTTAPFIVAEQFWDGTPNCTLGFSAWTNYNTFDSTYDAANTCGWSTYVSRIYVDTIAASYTALYGSKGNDLKSLAAQAIAGSALPAGPTTVGVMFDNFNSLVSLTAYAMMFRVDITNDKYLVCGGLA